MLGLTPVGNTAYLVEEEPISAKRMRGNYSRNLLRD